MLHEVMEFALHDQPDAQDSDSDDCGPWSASVLRREGHVHEATDAAFDVLSPIQGTGRQLYPPPGGVFTGRRKTGDSQ